MKKIATMGWMLFICWSYLGGVSQAQKLQVVASFSILGDLVKNVGGDHVQVSTLVGADGDAHVYEPTPADAKAVAGAQLVVVNGLGFEGWLERLLQASGFKGKPVIASEGIAPQIMQEAEAHSGHSLMDPHAWQSLSNGKIYTANIMKALIKIDPLHAEAYKLQGQQYLEKLDALERWVKQELQAIPVEKRKVITSHDAFGYFSTAYGVKFFAPMGWSTESEPSAKQVANLIQQIRQQQVKVLFLENITDPRLVKQIAQEAGGVLGGSLYSDALSTPESPASSYEAMFRHNVLTLKNGLLNN